MSVSTPEHIRGVFESSPAEIATWLVCLESLAKIQPVAKNAPIIDKPTEVAAKRIISALGNGNYDEMRGFVTQPEKYGHPGMLDFTRRLGRQRHKRRLRPSYNGRSCLQN